MTAQFPDPKDDGDSTPWTFDLSDEMTALGDTIASGVWTVPSGLTKVSETNDTTTVTVRVSGGTIGQEYQLDCVITTTAGEVFERSAILRVDNVDA